MFGDFNQLPPPKAQTLADAAVLFALQDVSIEIIAKNVKFRTDKKLEIIINHEKR